MAPRGVVSRVLDRAPAKKRTWPPFRDGPATLGFPREAVEEVRDIDGEEWLEEHAENRQFLAQFASRLPPSSGTSTSPASAVSAVEDGRGESKKGPGPFSDATPVP